VGDARSQTSGYRPEIDGLRAVAVLAVVLFHARAPGFSGGFVGVDVFFVISGFLITGILLTEADRDRGISIRDFYARRARRLLPAAVLVILVTLLAAWWVFPPAELANYAQSALMAVAYLANVRFMQAATNYFAASHAVDPFLHTWSLAVEEQFYLFWPLTLLLLSRRFRGGRTLIIVAISAASFFLSIWISHHSQPTAFFGAHTRAWEFGLGALAWIAQPSVRRVGGKVWRAVGAVCVLALAWAICGVTAVQTPFPGWIAVVPAAAAAGLLLSTTAGPPGLLRRTLASWPMRWTGRFSYAWYLWHWPLLVLPAALSPAGLTTPQRLACIAVAFGLAALTYFTFENPIRHSRWLIRRPNLSLLATGGASLAAAMLVVFAFRGAVTAAQAAPYRALTMAANDLPALRGCLQPVDQPGLRICTFGGEAASRTIVLFGDSHAAQWLPALEQAFGDDLRIVTIMKSSCPVADVRPFNARLARATPECDGWRDAAIERIVSINPAVVIASSSQGYVMSPARRGGDATISYEAWEAGHRRVLSRFARAGVPLLLLHDTPRGAQSPPECLARAKRSGRPDQVCDLDRASAIDLRIQHAEQAALAGLRDMRALDLTDQFCGEDKCPAVRGGVVVYRDSNHITASYSKTLAETLGASVRSMIGEAQSSSSSS
jgi:peptidoglycan/LPS O-acetylase OafA/YrhL